MTERWDSLLAWLTDIPEWWLYSIAGLIAAVENLFPPFPSDVIVTIGSVAAGAGSADPRILFLFVWLCNVSSALLVYALGRRYGATFFAGRFGRYLLAPKQVDSLGAAYRRFGFPIIFFSRFLPVFRPIVPVFAGVARLGFWRTAIPVAAASAVWYGLLVYLGALAGANWRQLLAMIERFGTGLWIAAGILILLFAWWWMRSRRQPHGPEHGDRD